MRTIDPVKHQAKRQHIVFSAAELFATRGFDGTTTAEICRAAGVSSGNLFHYFSSKREIFAALFEDAGDETADRIAAANAADNPWAGLTDLVQHLAAPAVEPHVPNLVLEAMLQAFRDPDFANLLGENAANEEGAIQELLTKASGTGHIDPTLDPKQAAKWVMALISALFLSTAFDDDFDPAEQLPMLRLILERFLRPSAA